MPSSAPRVGAARPAGASSVSAGAPTRESSGWNATPPARQSIGSSAGTNVGRSAAAETTMAASTTARELSPFPAMSEQATGYASTEPLTEGALAKAPETVQATNGELTIESIRQDIVSALATAGHGSAALLLGNGAWRLESTSVHVSVPGMSKKMLSLTVSPAVEKIARQELQRLGAPTRFVVSAGEGSSPAAITAPIAPAGSVQEAALAHPIVKRAQEIFKAEVRSVVDLRQK